MELFSFDTYIAEKLREKKIVHPSAVQKELIPLIYEGGNCLFESETGTGKTVAYLLPLLRRLYFDAPDKNEAIRQTKLLIAAPTKELASQIKTELNFFLPVNGKTLLCCGGSPLKRQFEGLKEKPFALIGTPGRLLELVRLKRIKTVQALIFDEADRLLSKEMCEQSIALIKTLPAGIQFCACSATLTHQVQKRLHIILQETGMGLFSEKKTHTRILPKEKVLAELINHWALYSQERNKADTLRRFLAAAKPQKTLVFCSGTNQAEHTAQYLAFKKIDCGVLHSQTDKIKRKQALDKFKNGSCTVLVTSDLASRGLDINGISHVIQLGLPKNPDFFVHRAGRTGRSGNTGINVVIGTEAELTLLARFEKKLGIIVYPKEVYGGKVVSADGS